jgi:NAD(P)-dependent dehydrogenase (short-subunit alcohol dehydrogenase family)
MASVFVTGSSAGIGQETARQLVRGGHRVVLHARDDTRAKEAAAAVTGRHFKSRRELRANPAAYDTGLQDALLAACAALTGVQLPG